MTHMSELDAVERLDFFTELTYDPATGMITLTSHDGRAVAICSYYGSDESESFGDDPQSADMLDFLASTASFADRCDRLLEGPT